MHIVKLHRNTKISHTVSDRDYDYGDSLIEVAIVEFPSSVNTYDLLDRAFEIGNGYYNADLMKIVKMTLKNRSLSVGDVVEVSDGVNSDFYSCESDGWKIIDPEGINTLR